VTPAPGIDLVLTGYCVNIQTGISVYAQLLARESLDLNARSSNIYFQENCTMSEIKYEIVKKLVVLCSVELRDENLSKVIR
jgi:hypothetical protein